MLHLTSGVAPLDAYMPEATASEGAAGAASSSGWMPASSWTEEPVALVASVMEEDDDTATMGMHWDDLD